MFEIFCDKFTIRIIFLRMSSSLFNKRIENGSILLKFLKSKTYILCPFKSLKELIKSIVSLNTKYSGTEILCFSIGFNYNYRYGLRLQVWREPAPSYNKYKLILEN